MRRRGPVSGVPLAVGGLLLGACTSLSSGSDILYGDAGRDATLDAGSHAALDAASDAPLDAGSDATLDAASGGPVGTADASPDGGDGGGNVPIAIASGGSSTCVLLGNGNVYCWGSNENGQVGNGEAPGNDVAQPALVATDTEGKPFGEVAQIGVGAAQACALKRNGEVYCWGSGDFGALGDDVTQHDVPSPQRVTGVSGYTALGGGGAASATCALDGASRVYCWGSNFKSRLGHDAGTNGDVPNWEFPAEEDNPNPVAVQSLGPATALTLGAYFSCAIDDAGVACWGEDQDRDPGVGAGELGDLGDAGDNSAIPVRVPTPPGMKHLGAGQSFVCAWGDGTGATCWGSNVYGELATGGFASPLPPTPLALGDASVVEMKGTYAALLALTSDQTVWASGYNGDGELANGTVGQGQACGTDDGIVGGGQSCLAWPSQARDLTGGSTLRATHIAAGFLHACAIGVDQAVYCWGDNAHGELGIGATGEARGLPVKVVGLPIP